jgi:hypothetical protein
MNNLIAVTDFKNFHTLPQIASNQVRYDALITELQETFLIGLFGYHFYKSLKASYESSELEENPITLDAKWSNLFNGDDVVIEDLTQRFYGYKEALIRFCWCKITESNMLDISTNGMYTPKSENAERNEPGIKLTDEWNEMVLLLERNVTIYDYCDLMGTYPVYQKSGTLTRRSWL